MMANFTGLLNSKKTVYKADPAIDDEGLCTMFFQECSESKSKQKLNFKFSALTVVSGVTRDIWITTGTMIDPKKDNALMTLVKILQPELGEDLLKVRTVNDLVEKILEPLNELAVNAAVRTKIAPQQDVNGNPSGFYNASIKHMVRIEPEA
jgi:hypothetical protein